MNGKLIILTEDNQLLSFAPSIRNIDTDDYWPMLKSMFDNSLCAKLQNMISELNSSLIQPLQLKFIQLRSMLKSLQRHPNVNPLLPFILLERNHDELLNKIVVNKQPQSRNEIKQRLESLTNQLAESPYAFAIGPSGSGKSTTVIEKLTSYYKNDLHKHAALYTGMDNLFKWVKSPNKGLKILFIDEANLDPNGDYEIFEGLFQHPPVILIQGKLYPLSQDHKVIFAGNFNDFANREEHAFFKRHGSAILYDKFSDKFLKQSVMRPLLKNLVKQLNDDEYNKIIDVFFTIYKLSSAASNNPILTARNLQMSCMRFAIFYELLREHFNYNVKKIAAISGYDEVAEFPEHDSIKKALFGNSVDYDQSVNYLASLSADSLSQYGFFVTNSRKQPLRTLADQLLIREMKSHAPDIAQLGTRGILFEGPSGIGKSDMLLDYVKSRNYPYYILTPTDPKEMRSILLKAFNEGAIVIIDELNTIPVEVEKLLNQLMLDRDLNNKKTLKEGFFVIATENPATFPNRQALSTPLRNRFMKINVPAYPLEELVEILDKMGARDPHLLVDNFKNEVDESYAQHKLLKPTPRDLFRQVNTGKTETMESTLVNKKK